MWLTRYMRINYRSTFHMNPNSVPVSSIFDWRSFQLFFCLHDQNFYYEAFKRIKNWAHKGGGGRGFLEGCHLAVLVAEGYGEQRGTGAGGRDTRHRYSSCQTYTHKRRSADEVSWEMSPAGHLFTLYRPLCKGGTSYGKSLFHLPHKARWPWLLSVLLSAISCATRENSFIPCLTPVPKHKHRHWLHRHLHSS